MNKLVALSFAAMLLSSTAVLAQGEQDFNALDSDGDDKLSFTDLQAQFPDLTQEQFDAADIDGDDTLDLSQFDGLKGSMGGMTAATDTAGVMNSEVELPLFETIDADGDEKLAFEDLGEITGLTQEIFDAADIDNNDYLDRSQYEGLKGSLANPDMPMSTAQADAPNSITFESLDSDGDDKLAFSDLSGVGVSQEQFDAADIDNDDFLDETQYQALDL